MKLRKKILLVFSIIFIVLGILILRQPSDSLKPYNKLLGLVEGDKVFYTENEMRSIFPGSLKLEKRTEELKSEAILLSGESDVKSNVWEHFHYQKDEHWRGWDTFPVKMFDIIIEENRKRAPILFDLCKDDDNIRTAFYSILRPGKRIPPHYGPFKGVLRYHLGLKIPSDESIVDGKSLDDKCFIVVGGKKYKWKQGEGVLFDETFEHYVENNTTETRIIIFIDVRRPFKSGVMERLNERIFWGIKESPHNRKLVNSFKS